MSAAAIDTSEPQSAPSTPDRQQKILDAASKLVVQVGYQAITMKDLAKYAGISRATLYRYYSTKEQLFNDASIQWAQHFTGSLQGLPRAATVGERIHSLTACAVDIIVANPEMVGTYIETLFPKQSAGEHSGPDLFVSMRDYVNEALAAAIGEPLFTERYQQQCSIQCHLALANMLLLNRGQVSPEQAMNELMLSAKTLFAESWGCP